MGPHPIANGLAWLAAFGLAAAAVLAVVRLGPVGLVILGLLTLLVCSLVRLDDTAPTWGADVFRARMTRPTSPEQRAAAQADREAALAPLRFYRRCGALLTVAGVAALAWQYVRS